MMFRSLKFTSLLAVSLVGCMAGDDEVTSEVSSDLSWGQFFSISRDTNLPTSANSTATGADTDMTCFLTGVAGNMYSGNGQQTPVGQLYTTSEAGVRDVGGQFKVTAFSGTGFEHLRADSMCVNTTAGRTAELGWSTGSADVVLASATVHKRCFLTRIDNYDSYGADQTWASAGDSLSIVQKGRSWVLTGTGHAAGFARCIDVPSDQGEWGSVQPSVSWTNDLAFNDQNPGVQCFLTSVMGRFRANSDSDGVSIGYDAPRSQYTLFVHQGKGAGARCIE